MRELLYHIVLIFLPTIISSEVFDPRLDDQLEIHPAASKNPGFKVEVTKAGLDYVKEFSVRLLSRELPNIPMPPELKRDLGGGKGIVRIVSPKIADFRPPKYFDLELTEPNRLKWLMRAIQVRVTGGFDGTINAILPVQMRGLFETRINDMSFDLVAELFSAPTGQPFIKVDVCHAGIHSMDISISEVGAAQEFAFRAFKSTVTARLRPVITTELCRIITEMVNVRVNRILLGFPTQIPVTQKIVNLVGTNQNKFTKPESGNSADFGPHIPPTQFGSDTDRPSPSSLILDYRLIDPPSTANNTITTNHLGEISWFGRGKTPFYPHSMDTRLVPNNKKMLRDYYADYELDARTLPPTTALPPKAREVVIPTSVDVGRIDLDSELTAEFGETTPRRRTPFSRFADRNSIPRSSRRGSTALRDLRRTRTRGPASTRSTVLLSGGSRSSPDPVEFISAARGGRRELGIPRPPRPLADYSNLDTSEIELDGQPLPGALRPVPRRRSNLNRRRNILRRTRLGRRRRVLQRRYKRQLGGFSITHNNEAFLPFCLGDFLSGIEDEFPNEELELRYKSNAPPTFYFERGEARIRAQGSLFLSIFPKPKFLFHAFTNVEVDVKLNLTSDNRVVGTAEVRKLELKLTRSRISELSQESLSFISDLTKSIINDLATDIMQQGIPLPTVAGFGLRNPLLSMHPHFAVLESDFEFDESFLAPLIQEATAQALG